MIIVVVIYFVVLMCAYLFQNKLLFYPKKFNLDYNFNLSANDKELFLKTIDGETISAVYATLPENKKVMLYFHGNGTSLDQWKSIADEMLPKGVNVLLVDYRGYGKSTGSFSEQGFYNDGEAGYQYLLANGYTDSTIYFYGRSLGSGVAVELSVKHNVKGLILESPYTSVIDVAKKHHPFLIPQLLLHYNFNSLSKAALLKIPVLLFHGVKDETIPVAQGEKLAAAIHSKKEVIIIKEGNHANLSMFDEYHDALQKFLND